MASFSNGMTIAYSQKLTGTINGESVIRTIPTGRYAIVKPFSVDGGFGAGCTIDGYSISMLSEHYVAAGGVIKVAGLGSYIVHIIEFAAGG